MNLVVWLFGFNSRPRAEGDGTPKHKRTMTQCFNSRPRAEGDRCAAGCSDGHHCFNSRPRAEGDRPGVDSTGDGVFQFTPSRGGRPDRTHDNTLQDVFQFTPSRGGRPRNITGKRVRKVSIHALARRATRSFDRRNPTECFNSRPRAEGDFEIADVGTSLDAFQFTPSRGGRPDFCVPASCSSQFQFTPSRGGRRSSSSSFSVARSFQFTPSRGGRREYDGLARSGRQVSIHALARRATTSGREYRCD